MSRILIWSPNYAPELTGIAPLATNAAEWLARQGHNVEVVTPLPNYPDRQIHPQYAGVLWRSEQCGPVKLHRSWLRVRPGEGFIDKVLYEASYATASLPQVLRRIPWADAVVCVVPSLVAAVYASIAIRAIGLGVHRPRYIIWVQDLVLTAATAVLNMGALSRRLLGIGRLLEKGAGGAADCIVVCSPGFRAYLARLGVDADRIVTIYNGVDTDAVQAIPPAQNEKARFLYLGNLGYTQDFEGLIAATASLAEAELEVYGEGNAIGEVRRLAEGTPNIHIYPPRSWEALPALLASADVHVLAQRKNISEANLPSKLGPYLASGRPVLAAVDVESPAAALLRASGGAIIVRPEQPADLKREMRRLIEDRELRLELGRRGRDFAERRLSFQATLGRLEQAILG